MNGYASHMALIATLGRAIGNQIVHITELGCGYYSTPMWWNTELFPLVRSVKVYEHNLKWARYIRYINRIATIDHFPESVEYADIILIDNGDDVVERLAAITHVVNHNPTGLVILHDADEQQYIDAIALHFEHCIIYTGAFPHTALLWNGERFDHDVIKECTIEAEKYEC